MKKLSPIPEILSQDQNNLGIFSKQASSKVDGFNKDMKETMNYTSFSMHLASHDLMKELYRTYTYLEIHTV